MSPPVKKQKTSRFQPDNVVSTSTTDEATVAAGPDAPVTKEQINAMLRKLRNSSNIDQAVCAMKALHDEIMDTNEKDLDGCKAAAKLIVELEGVGTIHAAMKDWNAQSEEFSRFALGSFVQLTHFVETTRKTLPRLGTIKTILEAAKKHKDNGMVISHAVGLISNIADTNDTETKEEVAIKVCIKLVLETMKKWPNDAYIQTVGCDYFKYISTVDNIKGKLRGKGICVVLAAVIDKFLDSDDDEKKETYNSAKQALDKYSVQ